MGLASQEMLSALWSFMKSRSIKTELTWKEIRMLKQYAVIIGLSLSLGLTACGQSSDAPQAEQAKPESSTTEKAAEPNAPRANREGRAGREGRANREGRAGRGGREGRTPPEAAYAACDNLEAQSACTVETPRGRRDGVCRVREGDERAVCFPRRPEGGRNEGRRQRPSGQ